MTIDVRMNVAGLETVQEVMSQLPRRLRDRACRRGIAKAARRVAAAAKARAPKETGLLKLSIGQKNYQNRRGDWSAVIGARRGYRRQVTRVRGGRFRKATKYEAEYAYAQGVRDPAKYAHLVEYGHRIVRGGKMHKTGVVVGEVPAKSFLEPALEATRNLCMQIVRDDCVLELQRLQTTTGGSP